MFKSFSRVLAAAALMFAAAAPAHAYSVTFSSLGASSGVDPLGNTWMWGSGGWGSPGIGAGSIPFGGATAVNHFEIHFTGGAINFAVNANTQLSVAPLGTTFWTETQLDANSIAFDAGATNPFLNPGEIFFVNITMLSGDTPLAFTATWSDGQSTAVPEPGSLALLGLGLAGLAAIRRRKSA